MSSLRESLIEALAASRDLESPLLAASDDPAPADPATWSVRDHLAHIAHYREYAAAVLDAVRNGAPPPEDAEADLDQRNARILSEHRGVTAAEAVERANVSYDALAGAVERCSSEDLMKPRSEGSDLPAWRLVPGCGWGHVGQHLVHWHLDRGEPADAERAARRVHQIELQTFDDPLALAAATYNLGCFYATTGRPDEALALLGEALAQDAELRDWAQQDPDLASVRHLLPPSARSASPR